ncbi:MAG: hypothetical protein CVU05_10600 [Bacteroidetes bacterium HGW-Bacteroidetes-21]|nr:MAG: hypothetical protein CVU05_10600 [Bacteroidetes bacterium HGW-Bacteroidetes-21]
MFTILRRLFFLSVIILTSNAFSFAQSETAQEQLDRKGEVYFHFQVNSPLEILDLTKVVSIDNFKNNEVWAYANSIQFQKFLLKNIPYEVLPHPGDAVVEVWDESKGIWEFDTYPTYSQYVTMMTTFASDHANICRLDTLTTLSSGRMILALKITDNPTVNENEPEFLYSSSMHGDELTGAILMLRLIDYLTNNYGTLPRVTNIVNNIELWICPLANPDGTYYAGDNTPTGARRNNANNIDLNRNYPDPRSGQHPDGNAWQPETVAFMAFADEHDFVMAANFHGGAEVVNYPWDTWITSGNLHADDNWWEYVSKEYADTAKTYGTAGYLTDVISSGYTEGGDWYVIDGGRQDYMNFFQQCREVTIEVSSTKLPTASTMPSFWNNNYRSLLNYLEQCQYGVHGIVTDACTGLPIKAKVYVESHDQANDSSHVYSSLPVGDYHRPIYAGTYSITYSATGYTSQTITGVSVTNKNTTIRNIQLTPNAPVAAFTADHTTGCIATVQFNDNSGAPAGTTFLWNFGDGQTSTLQNPSHTYAASGNYTVTLTLTSCAGNDSETKTNYISLTLPTAPVTTPGERCGSGTVALAATGTGTLDWYDAASGGTLVNTGTTFTTPNLTNNTTYYVESSSTTFGASQYAGKSDNSGTGQYFTTTTGYRYMTFDCLVPIRLVSVKVYAQAAGDRTIELRNSAGTLINSLVVTVPASGTSGYVATLNFDIPAGTGYRLGIATGATNNLYISANITYPLTLANVISITGNSQNNSYYYFFYNWEVQTYSICSSGRTPVTATINTPPTANAGNDVTITSGNSTTLTATGGGTYLWSNGATSAATIVSPTTTTTYIVTVTAANGCTSTDNVVVTVQASTLAVSTTATPASMCVGGTSQLNASATGGTGYSYTWSSAPAGFTSTVQNPTVTPTVTTTYTVTVTSGANTTTSSSTVTVNPLPTANAGSDVSICPGTSATLVATGGTQYLWSNSAGNTASVIVSPTANTTYTVTVSSAAGCSATDQVTVTMKTVPVANAGADIAICAGQTANLMANGGTSYVWSNSLGTTANVNAQPALSTTYTVTVTGASGCTDTDDILVTVNDLPTAFAGNDQNVCAGSSVTLTASGGGSYSWSDGLGTAATVYDNPSTTQTYTVTVTDINLCTASDQVTVNVFTAPVATAGSDQSINTGETAALTGQATGGSGTFTYTWDPASQLVNAGILNPQTLALTQTTLFTLTVMDDVSGCQSTDDVVVTVVGGVLNVSINSSATSVCAGSDLQLNALVSGGNGGYTYNWASIPAGFTSSSANPVITPSMNSVYSVTVTDGSTTSSSSVSITVLSTPNANAGADVFTCPSQPVTLNATGGNSYLWSNGNPTSSTEVIPLTVETYYVTVTGANGCTDVDDVVVDVYSSPVANAGSDQTICEGLTASLTAQGGTYYLWDNAAGSIASVQVSPIVTTTYSVTVTDDNGCTDTDEVMVTVNSLPDASFTYTTNDLALTLTNVSTGMNTCFWYFGDGGISNQINPVYYYTNEGLYTVTLIATNSCGNDTVEMEVNVTIVGLPQTTSYIYNVYPNPASDEIQIELPVDNAILTLTDLSGRVILTDQMNSNKKVISVDLLANGTYVLFVKTNDGKVYREKIIINR